MFFSNVVLRKFLLETLLIATNVAAVFIYSLETWNDQTAAVPQAFLQCLLVKFIFKSKNIAKSFGKFERKHLKKGNISN